MKRESYVLSRSAGSVEFSYLMSRLMLVADVVVAFGAVCASSVL